MLKICGRPIVAVATYDADQEKPVEPMTIIEQREYKLPSCKRMRNGKMALVVRKHSSDGGNGSGAGGNGANGGCNGGNGGNGGKGGGNGGGGDDEAKQDGKKNGNGGKNGNGNGNGNGKKSGDAKAGAEGQAAGEKGDGGEGGAKPLWGEELTEEQDQILLQMKAEGKTWAEINVVIGRSKNTLQARFKQLKAEGKEITPGDNGAQEQKGEDGKKGGGKGGKKGEKGGGKEDKGGDKNENDQAEGGDRAENKNKKKENKKQDKAEKGEKPPSEKKSSSKSGSEVRFTKGEWMTVTEDDMFSFGELQLLSELLMQDEGQRWLRIASRFADMTGRKVNPYDIQAKFSEMAGMRRR